MTEILSNAGMNDGNQHDAQEFLTHLLNGLNDEYHKVLKNLEKFEEKEAQIAFEKSVKENVNNDNDKDSASLEQNKPQQIGMWGNKSSLATIVRATPSSSDDWETVTNKTNKRAQARLQPKETSKLSADLTPISRIFNGTKYEDYTEKKVTQSGKVIANT